MCGCYYVYIYKCIYVCVSLDCVWDMKRKQSNAPVSLPSGFSLSLGRDFCTSGGDPWLVFLLGNFWASQPVRQSLIKSTLQPQSATTCHNMLCLSFVTLTLSHWVCWTSEFGLTKSLNYANLVICKFLLMKFARVVSHNQSVKLTISYRIVQFNIL